MNLISAFIKFLRRHIKFKDRENLNFMQNMIIKNSEYGLLQKQIQCDVSSNFAVTSGGISIRTLKFYGFHFVKAL